MDPRSWCSTEKAQQKQQDIEHSSHVDLTGHLLCDWWLPLCCLLLDGIWLMDVLRAGKGSDGIEWEDGEEKAL